MAKFSFIKSDKKGNYRISAFTVCLIIAVVFWLLNSLSKVYSHKATFKLVYRQIPFNRQPANPLPEAVNIIFSGKGFDLLWLNLRKPFKDLKVDMPVNRNAQLPETFNISVADCFLKQYGTGNQDLQISYTEPDSIHFVFTKRLIKKVPVKFNAEISYKKRFGSALGLVAEADSITIAGTESALSKIQQIETNNVSLNNLSNSTDVTFALVNPDSANIFLSTNAVSAYVKVEEVTESFVNVVVTPPANITRLMVIPASVKVVFNTTLENTKKVQPADFFVTTTPLGKEGYVTPVVKKQPPYVTVVFVDPPQLQILEEK
ncbi:MAG TPA: hypothetical protein PKN75_09820 [Bacteroidia bacterium]|nr:hypothetical protein [Bacteroidia bacterium]HNU33879.1 hypothetical protein [Bacteroidia bacterium]